METTLFYARAACDTMMRKFAAADLPPKGHFYYHQGVFLSGVLKTWQLTGEQKYLDYAASWVHAVFDESGKVKQYKRADLDDIQAGILLYTLYDATGDESPLYRKRCRPGAGYSTLPVRRFLAHLRLVEPDVAGRLVYGLPVHCGVCPPL